MPMLSSRPRPTAFADLSRIRCLLRVECSPELSLTAPAENLLKAQRTACCELGLDRGIAAMASSPNLVARPLAKIRLH